MSFTREKKEAIKVRDLVTRTLISISVEESVSGATSVMIEDDIVSNSTQFCVIVISQ